MYTSIINKSLQLGERLKNTHMELHNISCVDDITCPRVLGVLYGCNALEQASGINNIELREARIKNAINIIKKNLN